MVQIWYRFGTDLVQIWYRFGTDLVQIWYRFGTDLVQILNIGFDLNWASMAVKISTKYGDIDLSSKDIEYRVLAFVDINDGPWVHMNAEKGLDYLDLLKLLTPEVHNKIFFVNNGDLKYSDFNFIKGFQWEFILLLNLLSSEAKNKTNSEFHLLYSPVMAQCSYEIIDSDVDELFKKLIFITFFKISLSFDVKRKMLYFFKIKIDDLNEKFKKLRDFYNKGDNLNYFPDICRKYLPIKNIDFDIEKVIAAFLLGVIDAIDLNNLESKFKNKVYNNNKKSNKREKEQLSIWIKKSTKKEIEKISSEKNICYSSLIDYIFEKKEIIKLLSNE